MGKKIAITGANGFIGEALVKAMHLKGFEVLALVHHEPVQRVVGVEYHIYKLEEEIKPPLFTGVSILIHGAFQLYPLLVEGHDSNIRAAQFLKTLNIPSYIFLSSLSAAAPVIPSYYARTKSAMEFIFKNDLIIRPGLVLGGGGLFGKIAGQLEKSKWVPLIDGGKQPIQTIFIDDLVAAILFLIEKEKRGIYNLAHPEPISYRNLVQLIADRSGSRVLFLPLPFFLLKGILVIRNMIRPSLFTPDNLTGFLYSRIIATSPLFQEMGANWLDTTKSLQQIK